MHASLLFLLSFSFAASLGALSYGVGRWLRHSKPALALVLDCIIVLLGIPAASAAMLVAIPFCAGGAYAEGKMNANDKTFFRYFLALLSSTVFPMIPFYAAAIWAALYDPTLFASASAYLTATLSISQDHYWFSFLAGYAIGILGTPSAIPIFRWLFNSSKLRPGLERHFEEAIDN